MDRPPSHPPGIAAAIALLLGGLAALFGGGLGARYTFKEQYPEGHPYRTPYVAVYDADDAA